MQISSTRFLEMQTFASCIFTYVSLKCFRLILKLFEFYLLYNRNYQNDLGLIIRIVLGPTIHQFLLETTMLVLSLFRRSCIVSIVSYLGEPQPGVSQTQLIPTSPTTYDVQLYHLYFTLHMHFVRFCIIFEHIMRPRYLVVFILFKLRRLLFKYFVLV